MKFYIYTFFFLINGSILSQSKKELHSIIVRLQSDSLELKKDLISSDLTIDSLEKITKRLNEIIVSQISEQNEKQLLIKSLKNEIDELSKQSKSQKTDYQFKIDSLKKELNNSNDKIELKISSRNFTVDEFLENWNLEDVKYNSRVADGAGCNDFQYIDVYKKNQLYFIISRKFQAENFEISYENMISSINVLSKNVLIPNTSLRVGSTIEEFNNLYNSQEILFDFEDKFYLQRGNYIYKFKVNEDIRQVFFELSNTNRIMKSDNSVIPKNLKIEEIEISLE
jgi:hypothetical protein